MGLQRYRADEAGKPYLNGAVPVYTKWFGGPTLALIRNCPTPMGPRTVYVTGEADTFFSLPAACKFKGRTVRGWLGFEGSGDDSAPQFHPSLWSWIFPHVDRADAEDW